MLETFHAGRFAALTGTEQMSNRESSSEPAGSAARSQQDSFGPDAAERNDLLSLLVRRMAAGEQEALATLFDETSSLINGLLLRILEYPQDAEEALLDVYMKAWKNAVSYTRERGTVQAWLIIMARTIAIDRIRQKRALPKVAGFDHDQTAELVSGDASPEQQTAHSLRRRRVITVLRELPPEHREVLELAFYRGFTHSELARRLDQPLGTIKTRIRAALSRMKDILGEEAVA